MSRKCKKICATLKYIEHFLILTYTMYKLKLDIPMGITSFATGLKVCALAARIKKYKSLIKKKRNMIK